MPSKSQTFLASGTFTVPAGITAIWIGHILGGGGGGGNGDVIISSNGGGGGGAGQMFMMTPLKVTPGESIAVVVGGAGAGATTVNTQGTPGDPGGDTVVDRFTSQGGHGGSCADSQNGELRGYGGGIFRDGASVLGAVTFTGGNGMIAAELGITHSGRVGKPDGPSSSGGSGGGRGGNGGQGDEPGSVAGHASNGAEGPGQLAGIGGRARIILKGGGGGGAGSMFGRGGNGGDGQDGLPEVGEDVASTSYGAGGGGSVGGVFQGGNGAGGYVLIKWVG